MHRMEDGTGAGYGSIIELPAHAFPQHNSFAPKTVRSPSLSGAAHTALTVMGYQQQQSLTSQPYNPMLRRSSFGGPSPSSSPNPLDSTPNRNTNATQYMPLPHDSRRNNYLGTVLSYVLVFVTLVTLTAAFMAARYGAFQPTTTEASHLGLEGIYTVYVVRHAEHKYAPPHKCDPPQYPVLPPEIGRCEDGDNRCGGDYLVEEGIRRSLCIASTVDFGNLQRLYARPPGPCHVARGKREYQTALPLSLKTGVSILTSYDRGDEKHLAKELRREDIRLQLCTNPGGTIVIFWDHRRIPNLLKHMGCETTICEEGFGFYEFDRMFRLLLSCDTGEIEAVQVAYEDCQQPEDAHYNYTASD